MAVKYRIGVKGERLSKPLGLTRVGRKLRRKMSRCSGRPWTLRTRGQNDVKKRFKLGSAVKKAKDMLKAHEVGDVLIVGCEDGTIFIVRKVQVAPAWRQFPMPEQSRDWHPTIKDVYQFVHYNFKDAEDWGTCNCRKTRQGGSWSQHSRWADGCRATDVGVGSNKALGDKIYNAVKKRFGSSVAIVWQTSLHYDHLHIQVSPAKTGTPVCGGGSS